MKTRIKIILNSSLAMLLFFTCPIWIIVWMITGWKYMRTIEWLINNPKEDGEGKR